MPLSIPATSLKSRSLSSHGSLKDPETLPLIPTSQLRGLTSKQKTVLALAAGIQTVQFFAESSIPLLFPPEAISKGLTHVQYGVIMAVTLLFFGLTAPFQSALLPKIGLKPGFILVSSAAGLSYVAYGLLHYVSGTTAFAILALLIRSVQGLFWAAAFIVEMGMMCLTLGDQASIGFAIGTATEGIGYALGPVVTGPLAQATNFAIPFVLAGVIILMIGAAGCCLLQSGHFSEHWTTFRLSDVRILIKDGYVLISVSLLAVLAFTYYMVNVTLEQHLARYNKGVGLEGLIFGLGDASFGLSAPLWGWLGGKHPKFALWSMLISPLFAALGNVFIGPVPGLSAIDGYLAIDLASLIIIRIAMSALGVGASAVMLERAEGYGMPGDLATYALVSCFWYVPYSLSSVPATVAGAQIYATAGFPVLTLINVVLLVAAGVIAVIVVCWMTSNSDFKTNADDGLDPSPQDDKQRLIAGPPSPHGSRYGAL